MSREIIYYEKVDSQAAFLAGAADIALNTIAEAIANPSVSVETDIFYVGNKGIDGLYEAILERLRLYNELDKQDLNLEPDSFMPNVPLEQVKGNSIIDALVAELYPKYAKGKDFKNGVASFYYSLSWYLKPAKALWKLDMETLRDYMPSLEEALALNYTYIVSDVYFLEFKDYTLMLIVGSNE